MDSHTLPILCSNTCTLGITGSLVYLIMIGLDTYTCGYTAAAQLWGHNLPVLWVLRSRTDGGEPRAKKEICNLPHLLSTQDIVSTVSTSAGGLSDENIGISYVPRLFFLR